MRDTFIFPMSKIRDSITHIYKGKYYATRLENRLTYHATKKMKYICKGNRVSMTLEELQSCDIRVNMGSIKPDVHETIYATINNIVFQYKMYTAEYFDSVKHSLRGMQGYRFRLEQVYKIDEQKFNGLVILGKEKDIDIITKLLDSDYCTELIDMD